MSADNCLADGIRQKAITEKVMKDVIEKASGTMPESLARNWHRNQTLIDLSFIPEDIRNSILTTYSDTKPATRQKFMNYMIANRLKNLLEVIDEF
jgi:hypothetical protein